MKNTKKISAIIVMLSLVFTMCTPTTALAASKSKVKITPAKNISVLTVGSKKSIKPKTNVKAKKITYKVSNKRIAVVKSGKLIAKKSGTVKIKITVTPESKKYKTTSKWMKIKIVKKHKHNYKPVYAYNTVTTKPAYDEKILEKEEWTEQGYNLWSNGHKSYSAAETEDYAAYLMSSGQPTCSYRYVDPITHPAEYKTIHHDAVTTQQKYIQYYKCSKCSATEREGV